MEAELGYGATATVYQVVDTVLGVPRAVKLLSARAAASSPLRRRLLAEARAMARLDHPNILRVYDIGQEGDRDYVVMALARQGSLADWVDAHGPMPPDLALTHCIQVLSALHAAHLHGIVHRDVKPQNVLIGDDGRALLADFGIALLAEDQLRATRTGVAMGSLAFMAPEQRLDARSVTAAADLYAVGTTLYNLLTAANPVDLFAADPASARWAGLPPALAAAIRRAVAYAPADRFSDARAMARHLRALLADAASVPLPPPPEAPRLPGWEETERPVSVVPPRELRPPAEVVHTALTFLAGEADAEAGPPGAPFQPTLPPLPGRGLHAHSTFPPEPGPGLEATAADEAPLLAPTRVPGAAEVPPGGSEERAVEASAAPATEPVARPGGRWAVAAGALLLLLLGYVVVAGRGELPAQPAPVEVAPAGGPADSVAAEVPASVAAATEAPPPTEAPAAGSASEEHPADATVPTATVPTATAPTASTAPASPTGSGAEAPAPRAEAGSAPAGSGADDAPGEASVGTPALEGTWGGTIRGAAATLVLSRRGGNLTGTVTTTNPLTGASVQVEVAPTWDAGQTRLVLEEQLPADAQPGRYTLALDPGGQRLEGRYKALQGSTEFRVQLDREGP